MVVTVNHAISYGLRLSPFILPFAIMVVPDTLSRPGGLPPPKGELAKKNKKGIEYHFVQIVLCSLAYSCICIAAQAYKKRKRNVTSYNNKRIR